jgi:hypothetical protein
VVLECMLGHNGNKYTAAKKYTRITPPGFFFAIGPNYTTIIVYAVAGIDSLPVYIGGHLALYYLPLYICAVSWHYPLPFCRYLRVSVLLSDRVSDGRYVDIGRVRCPYWRLSRTIYPPVSVALLDDAVDAECSKRRKGKTGIREASSCFFCLLVGLWPDRR